MAIFILSVDTRFNNSLIKHSCTNILFAIVTNIYIVQYCKYGIPMFNADECRCQYLAYNMNFLYEGPKALIKYEKEILCFTRLGYLFFTTALGKS